MEKETVFERLQGWYWNKIPYDWRPGQIWYRAKCWACHRYTTVKGRYLPHTWVDRSEVLPHTMFEILSQFIEKECSPGIVDWYNKDYGHKIEVNGEEKFVRDEMQELYDWWHNVYNKKYREEQDAIWKEAEQHSPVRNLKPVDREGNEVSEEEATLYHWDPEFATEEDAEVHQRCMDAFRELEQKRDEELEEMLHRLIRVRRSMWT